MRSTDPQRLAELAGGRLVVPEGASSAPVGPQVVIDARRATPGSLFVAIPGERVDGHDFAAQAEAGGARAVLATRPTDARVPHVIVEDTVAALSELARGLVAAEQRRGMTTIAVTGSSGKTSTKDLLAQVLEAAGPTTSPVGSFNNEIGVPLTACGIDESTRFLVSEMGARGIGHVAWLCSITRPDVAMVLNVGTAHLGEFGSRENIARAKGEIVEALEPGGWAVLNADDDMVAAMASRTRGRLAWWTRTDWAAQGGVVPAGELHLRAVDISANALQQFGFTLEVGRGGRTTTHRVELGLLGSHQVSNALAAAAAAIAAGLDADEVARALGAATTRSPWRMEMTVRADGLAVLNDAYNANPDSMRAALSTFGEIAAARRAEHGASHSVAVLGDMLELGADADQLHRELGAFAVAQGIDEVIGVGGQAGAIVEGARAAGGAARAAERAGLGSSLGLGASDVVLVKASRGIGLEKVAEEILGAPAAAPGGVSAIAATSGEQQ